MIDTPRLHLRPFREADLGTFVAYRADPEVERYQSWSQYTADDARRFWWGMVDVEPFTPGDWIQLAIIEQRSGDHVGDVACLVDGADPLQATIGYTIAPAHHRRGFATEAVRGLVHHLFVSLHKHRVTATTDARNAGSIGVLRHVGFRQEAHHVDGAWFKGAWCDELVFALLRREWPG